MPTPVKRARLDVADTSSPDKDSTTARTARSRPEIILVSSNTTPSRRSGARRGRGRGRGGAKSSHITTPSRTNNSARAGDVISLTKPVIDIGKGKGREVVEPVTPSKSRFSTRTSKANLGFYDADDHSETASSSSSSPHDDEADGSDRDPDAEEGADDSDNGGNQPQNISKFSVPLKLQLPDLTGESSVRRTASDVYFYLTSKPSKTSSNVFSWLLPHLTPEQCAAYLSPERPNLASPKSKLKGKQKTASIPNPHHITHKNPGLLSHCRESLENQYSTWAFQLFEGFNLLLYGYGSKLRLLTHFAKTVCATKKEHIVVAVNGFWIPTVTLKLLLESIEQQIPGLDSNNEEALERERSTTNPVPPTGFTAWSPLEFRTRKISQHFFYNGHRPDNQPRRLFLIIHNIDYIRPTSLTKTCLNILASNPHIHLVASVDNVHAAGSMWTLSEMVGRKPPILEQATDNARDEDDGDGVTEVSVPTPSSRSGSGFTWLWHEAHTFEPYDIELSFRDTTVLPRMKKSASGVMGIGSAIDADADDDDSFTHTMSENAARQVLASVTQKARRLFHVLGRAQLASSSSSSSSDAQSSIAKNKNYGLSYDLLMVRAREEFLATSDAALRALLTEFRDHGLVRRSEVASGGDDGESAGKGGKVAGDVFWIPLAADVLRRLLDGLSL